MIAYLGKTSVKKKYLARLKAHRIADELVQGTGWEKNGKTKGCAVGCTLDAYDHARYETELGIPETIARLEDSIFEGLPREKALKWPERFLKAIKPGADLSLVFPRFIIWLLIDPVDGVIKYAKGYPDCEKAIHGVADLYLNWEKTNIPPEAAGAARAAWAAGAAGAARAAGAAWAARAAEAARATEAAWAAGAVRAARAAWAARAVRAAEAARAAEKQADKLIELLKEAK